jgi:hypothetical protein
MLRAWWINIGFPLPFEDSLGPLSPDVLFVEDDAHIGLDLPTLSLNAGGIPVIKVAGSRM